MRVQLARAKEKSKKDFPQNCFIISFLPYSLDQGAMFFIYQIMSSTVVSVSWMNFGWTVGSNYRLTEVQACQGSNEALVRRIGGVI